MWNSESRLQYYYGSPTREKYVTEMIIKPLGTTSIFKYMNHRFVLAFFV